jgi:adenylate cyclase
LEFVYDVWGDTVNVASRLDSTSEPNQIHVSEPVAAALQVGFVIEPRASSS